MSDIYNVDKVRELFELVAPEIFTLSDEEKLAFVKAIDDMIDQILRLMTDKPMNFYIYLSPQPMSMKIDVVLQKNTIKSYIAGVNTLDDKIVKIICFLKGEVVSEEDGEIINQVVRFNTIEDMMAGIIFAIDASMPEYQRSKKSE